MQGLFSGEIFSFLLPKISLKLTKWEEKSHRKILLSCEILLKFPIKDLLFLACFGLASDFLPLYFRARIIAVHGFILQFNLIITRLTIVRFSI